MPILQFSPDRTTPMVIIINHLSLLIIVQEGIFYAESLLRQLIVVFNSLPSHNEYFPSTFHK